MNELESVVATLQAKLREKEKECKLLKEENEMLLRRMQEMEGRMKVEIQSSEERMKQQMEERVKEQIEEQMKERLSEQMEEKVCDMVKQLVGIEGAIGGGSGKTTSTPLLGKEWLLRSEEKSDPEREESGAKVEKKKKKSSKNRRHERKLKARLGKSTDSLYSSVGGEGEKRKEDTSEDSSSEDESVDVLQSLVIREVPRIGKYVLYGSEDIEEFFRKYESYCKRKVGEDERYWVRELGEFLDGRLAEYYRIMIEDGDQKYDDVKERLIEFVKRVKGGVKYKKKNAFDEARMREGESLESYACRLESAARKKFGKEGINENKMLMKKFLSTVPSRVCELVNARRKEKMRWNGTRLMWDDVLEMIEDNEFDEIERGMDVGKSVYVGGETRRDNRYASYRDAVRREPLEVVAQYLMDFYENGRGDVRKDVYVGNHRHGSRNGRREQKVSAWRDRSVSRGRSDSRNRSNRLNGREIRCHRCDKVGHMMSECRWAKGACFGCGQMGHLISNCPSPREMKCFRCGCLGHRANDCERRNDRHERTNVCGNCGQSGHFARMCKLSVSVCEICGVRGHVANVCYRRNDKSASVSARTEGSGSVNGMNSGN